MIGMNILQVVSAIVPSNNRTVDCFGGSSGVPFDVLSGALMYTTYSIRTSRRIPYAKATHQQTTSAIYTAHTLRQ